MKSATFNTMGIKSANFKDAPEFCRFPNCADTRMAANYHMLLRMIREIKVSSDSVDNTQLPCYTLPPTQRHGHHSFLRNLPPLYLVSGLFL